MRTHTSAVSDVVRIMYSDEVLVQVLWAWHRVLVKPTGVYLLWARVQELVTKRFNGWFEKKSGRIYDETSVLPA